MKLFKNITIVLLLFLVTGTGLFAQRNSGYFYYYKGERFYLQPDLSTIAVSIRSAGNPSWLPASLNDAAAVVAVLQEDKARSSVVITDADARKNAGTVTWYAEIKRKQPFTAEAYNKQLQEYARKSGVVLSSPCFLAPGGKNVGLSNNFYVQLKNKKDIDQLYSQAALFKTEVLGYNPFMPLWFILSCNAETGMNALEAANRFYETGLFQSAEPELVQHNLLHSADTYFNNQWGLLNTGQHGAAFAGIDIRAEQAWAITTGSAAIRTAVYDEGYELNHPDLAANNIGTGYDANTGGASVVRGNHGTACAGIVGAVQNNNIGVSGVAPNSRLMSVSIGFSTVTYNQLANGFNWAWQNGADVISNSWGGGTPSSILDAAITNTLNNGRGGRGTVVVFSSGNGNGAVAYPANSNPRIIAVGAMSPCGQRKNPSSCDGENWWGSDFGAAQDVVAPGVLIPTTDRQGTAGYAAIDYTLNFNGTSAACPHVSGVAALVLSVNPNLTVQQVSDIIEQSAQKVRPDLYAYTTTAGRPNGTWNNEMGYGLVNAHQAVVLAQGGSCVAALTVTAPVVAPNTDNRQASGSITATNIINNGARGIYHAGGSVTMLPGFRADFGSQYKAYVEGCSGSFIYRAATEEPVTYEFRESKTPAINTTAPVNTGDQLVVQPNPFNNQFRVQYRFSPDQRNAFIEIFTVTGKRMHTVPLTARTSQVTEQVVLNTEQWAKGTYILVLKSGTEQITRKLVKQ